MNKWLYGIAFILCMNASCTTGNQKAGDSAQPSANVATPEVKESVSDAPKVAPAVDAKSESAFRRDAFGLQTDTFASDSGKAIAFHCIKHGSVRIEYDGLEFEIDPVMKLNERATDYNAFPDADYLIITHEHQDHFDPEAIQALEKPGTVLITNAVCAAKLGKGDVMANGDARTLREDIQLEAVPAYNTTPGHEKFHPKGRDNGFILTLDGFRIYIAGDTEDIDEMDNIKDIDVAFLPCNQPYTMTVEQLTRAAERIQPRALFPYHYSDTPMSEVITALKDSKIDLRIRDYQ